MDEWTEIRRKVLVEGASKRSIHRDYGIGHQALAKILANAEPPGYQMAEIRRKPVLGPHLATIDADPGRRQRGPAQAAPHGPADLRAPARRVRLHRLLLPGADGGEAGQAVLEGGVRPAQSHPPGHAQFDFGEAVVEIAGERTKAALGVITLPYSDTYFLSAYPRECTETFQAAHVAGFEFFGGVPLRISYDNTTIAVSKVIGQRAGADQGVLDPREPPPLRPSLLPGRAGQREGPRGEPRRLLQAQPVGPGPVVPVVGAR